MSDEIQHIVQDLLVNNNDISTDSNNQTIEPVEPVAPVQEEFVKPIKKPRVKKDTSKVSRAQKQRREREELERKELEIKAQLYDNFVSRFIEMPKQEEQKPKTIDWNSLY
jgi:hypothetical protein